MTNSIDYEYIALNSAANGSLPDMVNDDSIVPVSVLAELIDSKLLTGHFQRSEHKPFVMNADITLSGRKRLAEIEEAIKSKTWQAKLTRATTAAFWWTSGIASSMVVQLIMKWLSVEEGK